MVDLLPRLDPQNHASGEVQLPARGREFEMNKEQKKRLAELKKDREELEVYRDEHRKEFGPSDGDLLDVLENYIHEHKHIEINLVECQCGGCTDMLLEVDDLSHGTDLKDLLTQMMKEEE